MENNVDRFVEDGDGLEVVDSQVHEHGFVEQDWKDAIMQKVGARHSRKDQEDMQTMHDICVRQGAHCPGMDDSVDKRADVGEPERGFYRIAKVDDNLGMVFGWSLVSMVKGEPYYDLNIDLSGPHAGQRVPEHIPEDAMLKASIDFAQTARVGNEMHKEGTDAGTFVFVFPLTTDIAKAMGIETNVTGLMVGFKPPPELLSKFKDGTYTGFSIEGSRKAYIEHED